MDTDYFFLCPNCGKMTIATGSGDMTDIVKCHECQKEYKAYYTADVGQNIKIKGQTITGVITKVYATEKNWFDTLHKK